jgi:SAM-dependent methyltransferase
MKQKYIFLESEGNAWFERNREKLGRDDPVSDLIEHIGLVPTNVLEVGCANGWRLAKLRDKYGCDVMGIEPSLKAGVEAAALGIPVFQTTASTLPFAPETFDLVIFGFCLYLTDPSDWLRIAAEADTVLEEGGHIIIHDFESFAPHARSYKHRDGIVSYHVDWAKLWLGHPGYHVVRRTFSTQHDTVVVLRKALNLEVRT